MNSKPLEHRATVQKIASVGRRYIIIEAQCGPNFLHAPGQYTKLTFEDADGSFERFYSIASAPRGDGSFELCLILDDERLRQIIETWNPGSSFRCSAPGGRFQIPTAQAPLVGIAGGSGITPLKAIVENRVAQGQHAATTLMYGCKSDDEIPFYESLVDLSRKDPELKLEFFAELTPLQRAIKGRPQDFLASTVQLGAQYLLCGPPLFMESVYKQLEQHGVAVADIHQDRF